MNAATSVDTGERTATEDDSELHHFFCCDENRGLCGTDLTDVPIDDLGDDDMCLVCEDLDQFDGCDDPNCPERNSP